MTIGQQDPFHDAVPGQEDVMNAKAVELVLPPGVAPDDQSEPYYPGAQGFPSNAPVGGGTGVTTYTTTSKQWGTDNADALPVFQRAAQGGSLRVVLCDLNNGGTAIVVGRLPGRQEVTISVPTLLSSGVAPLGVVLGFTEGEVQQAGQGAGELLYVLNPGDSVTLRTEAPIWAGVIPGNSTGACQVMDLTNPLGGQLGY